jgi:hypothetical protein
MKLSICHQLYMDTVGSQTVMLIMVAEAEQFEQIKHIPDSHNKKHNTDVWSNSERSRTNHKHQYVAC